MLGLDPKDFQDYHTYEIHRTNLERAQKTAVDIYDAGMSLYGAVEEGSGLDYGLIQLVQNAAQIGYESALGLKHKATDYDIIPETLTFYPARCIFCNHRYTMDGCEMNCSLEDGGEPCKLEVKEYLD